MRKYLLTLLIFSFYVASAQKKPVNSIRLIGTVVGKPATADSIFFNSGVIDKKYFENDFLSAELVENKFFVKNNLAYPKMFKILFKSEQDRRIWRLGNYFVSPSTNLITINYTDDECNFVNGDVEEEYLKVFIPYFFKGKAYDCKSLDMYKLSSDRNTRYDTTLYSYVKEHPSSYVALWSLIERFSLFGHSGLREATLTAFSNNLKNQRLWKILNGDMFGTLIKENKKFPPISLKTNTLESQNFATPKAKYTLVDYWFARCRPCLDTLPVLKKIYKTYNDKGFEIVSISADLSKDIPLWQKRIRDSDVTWPQYLQENELTENKAAIKYFPSFFLLDSNGTVIWKDFDLHELDDFLKAHLSK